MLRLGDADHYVERLLLTDAIHGARSIAEAAIERWSDQRGRCTAASAADLAEALISAEEKLSGAGYLVASLGITPAVEWSEVDAEEDNGAYASIARANMREQWQSRLRTVRLRRRPGRKRLEDDSESGWGETVRAALDVKRKYPRLPWDAVARHLVYVHPETLKKYLKRHRELNACSG